MGYDVQWEDIAKLHVWIRLRLYLLTLEFRNDLTFINDTINLNHPCNRLIMKVKVNTTKNQLQTRTEENRENHRKRENKITKNAKQDRGVRNLETLCPKKGIRDSEATCKQQ